MKISELMKLLRKVKASDGDLEVTVFMDGNVVPVYGLSVGLDEDEKPQSVCITDETVMEMFWRAE